MIPKHLEESIAYLKEKGFDRPEVGIVLGTGLGQLVHHLAAPIEAHYNQIPFFPLATVEFHSGKLYSEPLGEKK